MSSLGPTAASTGRIVVEPWPGFHRDRVVPKGTRLGEVAERVIESRTLDTPDARLQRAGIFVRSDGADWAVEFGRYGTWRTPATDGRVTSELAAALAGLADHRELTHQSLLRHRVRLWPLLLDDGSAGAVGELRDESLKVIDGRRVIVERRYVTVLGPRHGVDEIRHRLSERDVARRLVVGYSMTDMVGGTDPSLWKLDKDLSAAVVLQRSLAREVGRLLAHDPVTRTGIHIEGVHQMRVATRALRSTLRTFAPLLGPIEATLLDDLRWLGDLLGEVRDLDVLIEELESRTDGLVDDDRRAAHDLCREARSQRRARYVELAEAMAGERYAALVAALRALADDPRFRKAAHRPAEVTLRRFARRAFKRLRRAVHDAKQRGGLVEDVHVVRLLAKKFRYSLDAIAEVSADAMAQSRALARLQKSLGEHHDACVAEEWLRSLRASEEDPSTVFVIGQLVASQHERIRRSQREWTRAWRRTSRPKARSWLTH